MNSILDNDLSSFLDVDPTTLSFIAAAFVLGGLIKGLTGFGLPLVTIPVLSFLFPVSTAFLLTIFPMVLSNAYLLFRNEHTWPTLRRFSPLMIPMVFTLIFSTPLLVALDETILMASLGVVVTAFSLFNLSGLKLQINPLHERWISPVIGIIAGLVGGLTTLSGLPVLIYLVTLNLPINVFVTAVAIHFMVGGLVILIMLATFEVFTQPIAVLSTFTLIPLFLGLFVGQYLRSKVSQQFFRMAILIIFTAIGISLIIRNLF